MADTPERPRWFTPERMLLMFCIINLMNYLDRGTIASNGVNGTASNSSCNPTEACYTGSGIQGDFGLNNFEDGVLSSAFMVGLLISSPVFAHLVKVCSPFRLIGIGLTVWTFATAACGFSVDFWSLTICRMLVGIGEASFISLAAPFVIDVAPPCKKTAWLSVFYMCIPVGMALGYVYGGVIGNLIHWRAAFWGEAIVMLPFAIFSFASKPLVMRDFLSVEIDCENVSFQDYKEQKAMMKLNWTFGAFFHHSKVFLDDTKVLFSTKSYTSNVLGYIFYTFVLGAYSYWGPRAGYSIYNLDNADLVFGGMTVICGIFGTVAGGIILDRIGSTVPNSFKLLAITTFIGTCFCFISFISRSLLLFLPLFSVGELFIFAVQGPVNYLTLQCVPVSLRPLSMAVSTVCIHVFGDVPSSPLVGALQDQLNNWRTTSLILTAIFYLASLFWFIGSLLPVEVQLQTDTNESQTAQMENLQEAPLLGNA